MKKNTTALRKNISSLAKKHGTPLFLISKSMLIEQVNKFQTLLPSVKPFYAVKANAHPFVLKIFAEYGIVRRCVDAGDESGSRSRRYTVNDI
jgi:ornithine decarboxylase